MAAGGIAHSLNLTFLRLLVEERATEVVVGPWSFSVHRRFQNHSRPPGILAPPAHCPNHLLEWDGRPRTRSHMPSGCPEGFLVMTKFPGVYVPFLLGFPVTK